MREIDMSTVSVVIPAYNSAATIADAVSSVRAQTVKPLEIIVVDDASRDGTAACLDELHAPDLRVIRRSVNGGGSAARNLGMEAARGDWIAFLDADDLWLPDKLERQLAALRACESAFCFTGLWRSNEYGERWQLPRRGPRPGESLVDFMLKSGHVVQTSTLLVPRALGTCRFREELRRFQDIDFVMQLEAAGIAPVFVEAPLVEWRNFGGGGVSAVRDRGVLRDFIAHQRQPLTLAQRLGLELRSFGPPPGIVGAIAWLLKVFASVGAGALGASQALSLVLKNALGVKSYGLVRNRLGIRS